MQLNFDLNFILPSNHQVLSHIIIVVLLNKIMACLVDFDQGTTGHHHKNEDALGCCSIDLCTSSIKMDAEDTDLRLCFRIISSSKTYTLQPRYDRENRNSATGASSTSQSEDGDKYLMDDIYPKEVHSVSKILRGIPGNDKCAECSGADPDWASLNLGILLCIECSEVHRNLGVHISKVHALIYKGKPLILLLLGNEKNFINWVKFVLKFTFKF
ncbi:hypothetical protein HN51_065209 [Arachis hypogaea]|uniref:ADP-ribosylation factor GTPase-activating protein AGD4-like isoform X3 n=1 Tax=Arachis ipaensis TaxID=130454 RepID=UPI0007AF747A|nr:ADP-ribosylation factor GTPase-activating protein AGD4-like isoform X3 [Arachis ipaensis]XP_020976346.1 ADP-ribosylation factor GTPase-activating protein AGD4-like isoform X3 [Arachis ipaensis]XP_020976347.1 ADP-ribosylation factor GTPase-activating protein AGD4-like isoform X3 [Arachis ipaensis]XP_020976348.1 ADP-ribosylation factor GTPase-activating protein AGD4-like isoform X3 [Arachis ipaensis]XP_020976349.1 ADP-ribosylation factor GTPase-activating protein AGD4-like isoform X3 [Arachis 